MDKYISGVEAADIVGVTQKTIIEYVKKGILKKYIVVGKKNPKYLLSEVKSLVFAKR
jgi:predicted site-specific integrase-resolvase